VRTTMALFLILLCGCAPPGNSLTFGGTNIVDYFPFDGARSWEFQNDDTSITYRLETTLLIEETTKKRQRNVYTLSHTVDCATSDKSCVDGEELRAVRWHSSSSDGVLIEGYRADGADELFETPIHVSYSSAEVGETIDTVWPDMTWTSTFVGFESCPVQVSTNWTCAHFRVEQDGDSGGYPMQGDYWAVNTYNVVGFDLDGEAGRWELRSQDCDSELLPCNGSW
jgi:hypothetical protein